MAPRILVIDDSLPLLTAVREALSAAGYQVETSSQPLELVLDMDSLRPDLILLDVEMPEVKGTDVLARLRKNAGEVDAWFVLFSGLADAELEALAQEVGARGWIRKTTPLSPGRLAREVRRLLLEREKSRGDDKVPAMVIDDSRAMRHILRSILEGEAFEVIEAAHGADALAKLEESGRWPDLLLVDLNMPEMNGYEFVSAVRARDGGDRVKVLMVTSETDRSRILEALETGADEYLMKPFTRESLLEKLEFLGVPRRS